MSDDQWSWNNMTFSVRTPQRWHSLIIITYISHVLTQNKSSWQIFISQINFPFIAHFHKLDLAPSFSLTFSNKKLWHSAFYTSKTKKIITTNFPITNQFSAHHQLHNVSIAEDTLTLRHRSSIDVLLDLLHRPVRRRENDLESERHRRVPPGDRLFARPWRK